MTALDADRLARPIPACTCLRTYRGETLHRPGCARMAAIRKKYGLPARTA